MANQNMNQLRKPKVRTNQRYQMANYKINQLRKPKVRTNQSYQMANYKMKPKVRTNQRYQMAEPLILSGGAYREYRQIFSISDTINNPLQFNHHFQ